VVTPARRKPQAVAILVALALTGAAAGARAQSAPGMDRRVAAARQACAAGQVEQAMEILAQILVETGDTNAMYNQARCYQANGRTVQALVRFREYLRVAGPLPAAERNQIRKFISELEQKVGSRTSGTNGPPPPTATAAAETKAAADSGSSNGRKTVRMFAVATALLAIAPIAAGLHFGGEARQREQEILQGPDPIPGAEVQRQWGRAKRAFTLQWVSYGLGAALLVGAGAMYTLAGRAGSGDLALNAAVSPGSVSAMFSGRF
jgi:hypothetical protein